MIGRIGICLAIVCLARGLPACGADATSGIVGRAVDVRGEAIAGVEVWGVSRGATAREEVGRTRTDADGRFRLGPLGVARAVAVWFDGPGLARERREDVHVFEGRDHDIGPMVLVAGTRIAGRVVDGEGRPVAGVTLAIEVYRRTLSHTISSDQARWNLVGDAEGRFETASLPAGEATLSFSATGKVRTRVDRRTLPGTAAIDLGEVGLDEEVPVRGVVVDRSGRPAPKVEVMADYDYANSTTTDDQGRFALGGLGGNAGEIRLTSIAYFAPKPFPIGPDRANLRLEVIRAFEIKGRAVDAETGAPVNLETVRLCTVVHLADGTTSLQG